MGKRTSTIERSGRWTGGAGSLALLLALGAVEQPALAAVAKEGTEFQVNSQTSLSQARPDVSLSLYGEAVVVWQSNTTVVGGSDASGFSVQGQLYDEAGTAVGGQFQVNSSTAGDQLYPAVAATHDGRFLVVWQDATLADVRGRLFGRDGSPLTSEFTVNSHTTGSQIAPDVAWLPTGSFLVAWESSSSPGDDASLSSVQARRVDGTGAPVAAQVQVNTTTSFFQEQPAVAAAADGTAAIVWNTDLGSGVAVDRYKIQAQRYTQGGAPDGGELTARTATPPAVVEEAVAAFDRDGRLAVAWSGSASPTDTSLQSVELQLFDESGAILGTVQLVNEFMSNAQSAPSLAGLSSGGYQASWHTDDSAGTDPTRAIATATLNAEGEQQGESQANSWEGNAQEFPQVAFGAHGIGWIVWQSNGSAGSDSSLLSIQAQRYLDSDPTLLFYDGFDKDANCRWSATVGGPDC